MSNLEPLPPAGSPSWYPYIQSLHNLVSVLAGAVQSPIAVAPVAAFTGTNLSGAGPLTVQFTDLSTGSPTSYSWDFGDGGRSIMASPSHVYASGGTYTVSLTVTNPGGSDTQTREGYVAVTLTTTTPVTATPTAGNGFAKIAYTAYPNATAYRVGRNGVDTDGAGAWSEIVTGLEWSALKLVNGNTYTLFVTPIVNGADGPTTTVSVTPTSGSTTPTPIGGSPGSRKVPLIGRSGLPWNNIVFRGGTSSTYPAFESWRGGRPVDGVMTFPTRYTMDQQSQTIPRRSGDLMVWSVSPFGQGTGLTNQRVANGELDSQIATFAQRLVAAGWNTNRTAIRLGWENNGNWYEWGWDRGGTAAFIAAWRKWVTVCRANGLTNVIWDWCLNKGPQSYNQGYNWTTVYPGDEYVDVIGIDPYDYYSPSFNETQWLSQTTNRNPGLDDVLAFVKSKNKLMAVDEWGVCHGTGGGNDNPWYIGRMFEWLKTNATWVAWECTYDHPGNPGLNHMLSDGTNPLAAARYKQAYPNGWG